MWAFASSLLANFIGSLLAGMILAWAVYSFVTRRLEIIRPRQERIEEEIMVCNLLIRELASAHEIVNGYLRPPRSKERLHMHAWDALNGSQAIRFLPVGCLESLLRVYADLYDLEYFFLRLEEAQFRDLETANVGVESGAARLGREITEEVKTRLARSEQNCAQAILTLTTERDHLRASLGTETRA